MRRAIALTVAAAAGAPPLVSAGIVPPVLAAGTCAVGYDHADTSAGWWGQVTVACPSGETISEVVFAAWGNWEATCSFGELKTVNAADCAGPGCAGGGACPCPDAAFVKAGTAACNTCTWKEGSCTDAGKARAFVERECLGRSSCGPLVWNDPGTNAGGGMGGDPCPGDSKHVGVAVRCSGGWTGPILILTAAALYTGGGVLWGRRTGVGPATSSFLSVHPHWAKWTEVAGLVQDGVVFTRRRLKAGGAAGGIAPARETPLAGEENGRRRGGDAGASTRSPRKKSSRKGEQKLRNGQHDSERETEEAAGTPATAPRAPAPSAPAAGTTAGDGGRWVHVPN